jgi:predicted TIM-barrel enzyme
VLVGSGFGAASAPALLNAGADGAIVGTAVKRDGRVAEPVDAERVRVLRAAMTL